LTEDRRIVLQHMLEVSTARLHACTKTLRATRECIVNYALVDVTPHLLYTLFQFVSVVHPRLVHSLLDDAPDPVINQIKVRAKDPVKWTPALLEKSLVSGAGVLGRYPVERR